ncbi:MAG: type IV pili twitching motility protein PilT [Legionellales bacterium]|nr:type IV pili twitching motility protein PilT [Legionellales bacterium]
MDISKLLEFMVSKEASDLYLTTGAPPQIKIYGKIMSCDLPALKSGDTAMIAHSLMSEEQTRHFNKNLEMNLAISQKNIGRFRVNIFQQRSEISLVIRHIKSVIPSIAELNLPPVLNQLIMKQRGLILIVGATSSGKSTTLATMIEHRNQTSASHIITIEDPIEYIHTHKKSLVNQREIGIDTLSYSQALKNTLRQAPDVILIGEIRDQETMQYAINFAETGHLCLSTLHANNANQAFERIINFFPQNAHQQLLLDLSLNTVAIISQRLIPSIEGKRVPATEILLGSPLVKELISKGEINELKEAMEKSNDIGMQTFDMALYNLYQNKIISAEDALKYADSENNLRLKISLSKGSSPHAGDDLSLQNEKD